MPESISRSLFATRTAEFSPDRAYRYRLEIRWGDGPPVNFLMLNPSTADEYDNDPTVERCERRARMWGYPALVVTNLFAYRATDPHVMLAHPEPVGPENDAAILRAAEESAMVVCAWGNDGRHLGRADAVRRLLAGSDLKCLRIAKTGEPWHPLYLPYELKPVPYSY